MKFLAVTVLFALIQASPPVARKAADNAAGGSANVQSQSATGHKPATHPPSLTNPNQTKPANPDGNKAGDQDARYPVSVRELPPVSVTKDWADWGVWAFSGLLVVVGFLQVWLLYGTLRQIRRQADEIAGQRSVMQDQLKAMQGQVNEMNEQTGILKTSVSTAQKSADAALLNATAVINSERPWMIIELAPIPGAPRQGYVTFRAWNRGRTPAEVTEYRGDFFYHGIDEEFSSEPKYKPWERLYREYVSPGNSVLIYDFDLGNSLPADSWQWMQQEKKRLYFKGHIVYRDVIKHEEHESRFCYWISPAPGVGLIMGGERNWNSYT